MSGNADDGLLEEWLIKNMPMNTVIGDPKWWAKRIRNVLSYENANLAKPQPTPSQSVDEEDVVFPILSGGIFKHEKLGELYDRLQVHSYAVKHCQHFVDSLSKPQPTSQEYCCTHSWSYAKNKAWNNREFKLCKCDINESCSHCYPSDFKDGGKWDLCKPMKESN